jgi:hypothetical protein
VLCFTEKNVEVIWYDRGTWAATHLKVERNGNCFLLSFVFPHKYKYYQFNIIWLHTAEELDFASLLRRKDQRSKL